MYTKKGRLSTCLPEGTALEQQAQHLSNLSEGTLYLRARPIRTGRRVSVVEVDAFDADQRPVGAALCTLIADN